MKKWLLAAMVLMAVSVQAELLVNGDFETGDFTGWVNTATATIDSTTPLSGSHSAAIPNDVGPGAPQTLTQAFTAQTDPVTLSFDFSMPTSTGLGMQVQLGETSSGMINAVVWDGNSSGVGDVWIYDTTLGGFQMVLSEAVTFGTTQSFSLTINGLGAGFDYDLSVGSKSTSDLSFWQNSALDDVNEVTFVNEFNNTSYEIDNVSVVPEPATLGLLGIGALFAGLIRRWYM